MLVLTRKTSDGVLIGKNLLVEIILIHPNYVEFKVTQDARHFSVYTLEADEKLTLNAKTELFLLKIHHDRIRLGIESDESARRAELL